MNDINLKVGDLVKQLKQLNPWENPICTIVGITIEGNMTVIHHKHKNSITINSVDLMDYEKVSDFFEKYKKEVKVYGISKFIDKLNGK